MKIFLNLLAAYSGGQLTRAREFIDRFDDHSNGMSMVILKEEGILADYKTAGAIEVIDISIQKGLFRPIRRMLWENFKL